MAPLKKTSPDTHTPPDVDRHLRELKLTFIAEHYGEMAKQADDKNCSHVEYLGQLVEGEALLRHDRATQNRLRQARFPVIKTLDQFRWDWPRGNPEESARSWPEANATDYRYANLKPRKAFT